MSAHMGATTQPTAQPTPATPHTKSKAPVIIACVVVLIIAIVAVVLVFNFVLGNEQNSSTRNSATPLSAQEEGGETSSASIEIDDETRFALSYYASSFTELGCAMDGYDGENPSNVMVFDFAWGHTLLNAPNLVAQVAASGVTVDGKPANTVIGLDVLNQVSQTFIRQEITVASIPSDVAQAMIMSDVDPQVFSWWSSTTRDAVAIVTDVYPLSETTFRLAFNAYGSGKHSNLTTEALCQMSEQELMSMFEQSAPSYTGDIVIEVYSDDLNAPIKLLSYNIDD